MTQSHQEPGPQASEVHAPDVSQLITEDGAPVDSFLAEKQMRLLTEPLRTGWKSPDGRPFIVAANVGVFAVAKNPALVPDVFLSLDCEMRPLVGPERLRSYFLWEFGKPPDVVIEIVSDTPGGELSDKLRQYERMRAPHYVVFDPLRVLSPAELTSFALDGEAYVERERIELAHANLSLRIWDGRFEDVEGRWLRWSDLSGTVVPSGAERADVEKERADAEKERADAEKARADAEKERAERLQAKLRALGLDPDLE